MNSKEKASEILLAAESDLRKLIGEAAQNGDYSAVESVTSWASALSRISADASGRPSVGNTSLGPGNGKQQNPTEIARRTKRSRKSGSLKGYPKFAQSGDTLVKIGWSKSQKSEYKHKSPRYVLTAICDSLSGLFADRKVVAMDSVLPIKANDGNDIPDYQVYVCLAWLKAIGAVNQKGREGYTQNGSVGELQKVAIEAWNNLPEDK